MVPVESCFGGLGVYRMACLRAGSYGGDGEHAASTTGSGASDSAGSS
jgi:hypothetical protein